MLGEPDAAKAHKGCMRFMRHEPRQGVRRAQQFAAAVGAALDLDLALGEPLRADQHLPGHADQVGGGEFGARPLVEVVVEHVDALGRKRAIELLAGGVGVAAALLEVEDRDPERRHRLRPLDAGLVVEGLDDGADEPRHPDAVGAAVDRRARRRPGPATTAFIGSEYLVPK